jgi:hypothetical protein
MEYENIRVPISLFTNQISFFLLYLLFKKVNRKLKTSREKETGTYFNLYIYVSLDHK